MGHGSKESGVARKVVLSRDGTAHACPLRDGCGPQSCVAAAVARDSMVRCQAFARDVIEDCRYRHLDLIEGETANDVCAQSK